MSNINLIIEERSRDIGNFLVGRLLPFSKKRMVGPFIFIDHMGPSEISPGRYLDVDQHPHIGLSALTYLFDGEIIHHDSIGNEQRIIPGDVNWMTAGSGVVHTERTPPDWRDDQIRCQHGFQIWVALPAELEDMTPEFQHFDHWRLPKWTAGTTHFCLIAGKAFEQEAPVPVYSDLFMLEVTTKENTTLNTRDRLYGEIGICVVEGSVKAGKHIITKGQMLVSKVKDNCQLDVAEQTKLLIFGGQPFTEKRYIFWNFVSSNRAKIERASERWRKKEFPMVKGDNSYIPLP